MKPIVSDTYSSRFPGGRKYVAYNPQTRLYLHESCEGVTSDRNYAWVGTLFQANNMIQVFPMASEFAIVRDGEERELSTAPAPVSLTRLKP